MDETRDGVTIDLPEIPLEVQLKYLGMDVAIVNGEVVAGGRNSVEARDNALKVCPGIKRNEIVVRFIPDREDNVWFVS